MDTVLHIDVQMEERWVNTFCSMLKRMELDGSIGHSEWIALFSDGDGDFRPRFSFSEVYNEVLDKASTLKSFQEETTPALVRILYDADYCKTPVEIKELKENERRNKK